MITTQFDYAAPESLEVAVKLLKEHDEARVLAGGHSLLSAMKLGRISPSLLVDLRKINCLQGIKLPHETDGILQIGTMSTYAEVAADLEIQKNYRALAEAANSIGDAQIRNWGRIGDVFAYRDLASSLLAVALALEAKFQMINSDGAFTISASQLIINAFENNLKPSDIVTAIDFPAYVIGTSSVCENIKHPASGNSICGIAVLIEQSSDGIVNKCHVAATGITTYAIRLPEVEIALINKMPTIENIANAANYASESVTKNRLVADNKLSLLSDYYASAKYRTHLCNVLTKKALFRATKKSFY